MKVALKVLCQRKKRVWCVAMNGPCLSEIKNHVVWCTSGTMPVFSISVECT